MTRHRLNLDELVRRSRAMAGAAAARDQAAPEAPGRLADIAAFGPNPGALRLRAFIPPGLPPGAPLLVVLHGCTQTAAGFDQGCGWSDLAEAHGFALLLPEQRQANNPNRCFNWFEPGDTARGLGEAESIRAMVAHLVAGHRLDPARVFIAGLSAGGAMAATMLATHPEFFAAGAIFAGLPHGAAASMQEAFEAMATGRPMPAAARAAQVRAAAPHHQRSGAPWPRISIWQGEADTTVRPVNAWELAKQWTALHGLDAAAPQQVEPLGGGGLRRAWQDASGRSVVEVNTLPGLAHGVPIQPGTGAGQGGRTMPFILSAGVPAPHLALEFFGIAGAATAPRRAGAAPMGVIAVGADGTAHPGAGGPNATPAGDRPAWTRAAPRREAGSAQRAEPPAEGNDPGSVIRRALRAAGLLRGG